MTVYLKVVTPGVISYGPTVSNGPQFSTGQTLTLRQYYDYVAKRLSITYQNSNSVETAVPPLGVFSFRAIDRSSAQSLASEFYPIKQRWESSGLRVSGDNIDPEAFQYLYWAESSIDWGARLDLTSGSKFSPYIYSQRIFFTEHFSKILIEIMPRGLVASLSCEQDKCFQVRIFAWTTSKQFIYNTTDFIGTPPSSETNMLPNIISDNYDYIPFRVDPTSGEPQNTIGKQAVCVTAAEQTLQISGRLPLGFQNYAFSGITLQSPPSFSLEGLLRLKYNA
jgi:hypothetical protein